MQEILLVFDVLNPLCLINSSLWNDFLGIQFAPVDYQVDGPKLAGSNLYAWVAI